MAYPTIKLKRSSVSGRVPDSSSLEYGELALNYTDGKLYWKSASNIVKSHIIDSEVQDVLTRMVVNQEFGNRTTDSLNEGSINKYYTFARSESDITDIVDSAYIQFLQLRYLDSAKAIDLIDSAYVQARQAFGAGIDSADIIQLIDSAYVNARLNRSLFLDSAEVIDLIDSAYIQARQIKYDFLDSSEAIHLIDSAYVNARLNRSLFLDSAEAIDLIDSAYVQARQIKYDFLDSSEAINLINVYAFDSTNFNGMFATKSTTNLAEGTNKYYTKVRFDSDFATDFALRTTSNLTEGSNKYYTKARSDSDFSVSFALKSTTNLAEGTNKYYTKVRFDSDFGSKTTTNLAEGTNKYYTTARADSDAKRAISVTDAGGDGSLSYVPATGIITYTGPSATEVRAHFSAGLGIKINSGVVSLDSADSAVFASVTTTGNALIGGNLTIDGNFYVGGTTTTITASNLAISDNMLYLNQAILTTVSNAVGSGTAVVYTTIQDHNYQIGFSVTITGVNPAAYNLTNQTITAITTNSFTVANSAVGSFVSGGTARAQTSANPDLGFAFGYRDSSYHHGGFFRDATDGYFKVFHQYDPEPDSSVFINTSDPSFILADIQANNFRGALIGNASTATTLANTRTIAISGDVTGTATSFNGSTDITISAGITANTIVDADVNASAGIVDTKLATISTAGKVSNSATTATNLNTASAIVARDASGNFTAGTITAALTGNASTATTLATSRTIAISGDVTGTATSFNGSTDITISSSITAGAIVDADVNASAGIVDTKLATIATAGKVSNSATTATDANTASAIVARDASGNFTAGTITAALTGNASTATTLQTARTIAISGDVTGTATSFNGSANISISAGITAGSIVSADFSSATSLIIYNSAGTVLKTIYSPST